MDAIARIETSLGTGIVKVLQRLTEGELTTSDTCNVLLPIIRGGGNDVDYKQVQAIVWDAGLAQSMKTVGECLAAALAGGQEEAGNAEEAA